MPTAVKERATSPDFDFWMGKWNVRNRRLARRLAGSEDWDEFESKVAARPLPGGLGNEDVFCTEYGGGFVGMSFRFYDPDSALWSIYWADSRRPGLLDPPVRGANGHRRYGPRDLERIRLLSRLRETGMPIAEVRRYFALVRAGEQTASERKQMMLDHRAQVVEQAGWSKALKYFSFSHLEVEKNHQVFEDEIAKTVAAMRLEPKLRTEAKQLVDRCYGAFTTMFDSLCAPTARQMAAIPAALRPTKAAAPRSQTPELSIPTSVGSARHVRVRS